MHQSAGPDLNDVALFVHVVRAASFTAAAKKLGIPPSTASRRIARLEASLGARLLDRTTRKLRLTDTGREYFTHAERALDELAEGSTYVRALHVVPRGRIRITAPIGLGAMVTTALAPYLRATPNVAVDVELTERRVDLVADGFDIAIRGGPIESADFVARRISESTRYLFASKAYLDERGRPARIADLASHDLIATRASPTGAAWELFTDGGPGDRRRDGQRFTFKPRLTVNELLAAKNAALLGVGIVLLPSPDVDQGELERVLPTISGERGGLWLLYPARRSLTAAVRSCVEHLLEKVPASAPWAKHRRGDYP